MGRRRLSYLVWCLQHFVEYNFIERFDPASTQHYGHAHLIDCRISPLSAVRHRPNVEYARPLTANHKTRTLFCTIFFLDRTTTRLGDSDSLQKILVLLLNENDLHFTHLTIIGIKLGRNNLYMLHGPLYSSHVCEYMDINNIY